MKRAVHYIFWGKHSVVFNVGLPDEESHRYGWKTGCGSYFWKSFHGTTEKSEVTCKKCLTHF